jgi:hypothetical protein
MRAKSIRLELACGALLLGVAAAAGAQQPSIKDGLWEVTTTMDMGAAGGKKPPQMMQQCVTPEQAKDPASIGRGLDKSQCQITDHKVSGNTATWKLACKGEGAVTGTGSATYGGTTYSMTSTTTMTHGGQTMTMTVNQTGKYIGPCKP